jgi:2,3-bisphosphoglycerate-dependent phosphoglycerate mutase
METTRRPSELVLVRHAESARNRAKKGSVYFADDYARKDVAGIPDHEIPLTPEGHAQARKTGEYLCENFGAPDYLYHSGYLRTVQTAEEILSAYPAPQREAVKVRANQFIRERDPGYAYDMTEQEAAAAFPWLKEYWKTFGGYFARPPGGESLADVANRAHTFLDTIFRDRAGRRIFVVTHGGAIRCFRFLLERWDYERALRWPEGQSPKNCGITVYRYDERVGRLALVEYNTVAG